MFFLFSPVYDYVLLALSLVLVVFEAVATGVTLLIPSAAIDAISAGLRRVLPKNKEQRQFEDDPLLSAKVKAISDAVSFVEICGLQGFRATEHVVATPDGYLLGIHRIHALGKKRGTVFLQHGLLMNSEIWVTSPNATDSVALQLAVAGYDVWLGNNRGNKYSKKHVTRHPMSREFWNFCLDEFAMYDIPTMVDYVLNFTKEKSLTYIGFSQGCAQAFASLSIHPSLNEKINVFIALGPAMAPPSVGPRILHSLMTASPQLLFTLFGHRVILRSTVFWQSIMIPEFFIRMIDMSNKLLFKWSSRDISYAQKRASYFHLYSYTSVKCVVHWFQIIARGNGIHMFDDDTFGFFGGVSVSRFYQVPPYPTQIITTPIEIVYGTADTLLNIDTLLEKLPPPSGVYPVEGYEHLEMIWGRKVPTVIVPRLLQILAAHHAKKHKSVLSNSARLEPKLLTAAPVATTYDHAGSHNGGQSQSKASQDEYSNLSQLIESEKPLRSAREIFIESTQYLSPSSPDSSSILH